MDQEKLVEAYRAEEAMYEKQIKEDEQAIAKLGDCGTTEEKRQRRYLVDRKQTAWDKLDAIRCFARRLEII